jgi:hypothetical protein
MKTRNYLILLIIVLAAVSGRAAPGYPAPVADVVAGINAYGWVTPATLAYMRTNGYLGGTNNYSFYYPASVNVSNVNTLPPGSNVTVTVTGTSNQWWSFAIPQGATGATGATGADGANGINGTNGVNGINGTNGVNGVNGTNGVNCYAGNYTTNFTLGTAQATWTITLPAVATNYLVQSKLYLVAQSANPHGITLASGGRIDCAYVTGTLFSQQPYTILDQGDGRTFVVSMSGDKANFLDNTGQPYSFSQAFVADSFQLQAKFIYLIQQ